jgi:diphosphomevalonate decarboxylase
MKTSARAHPNIALSKYWGKRDESLFLPQNSSLGVTLDGLSARVTVAFLKGPGEDRVVLNGTPLHLAEGRPGYPVRAFLEIVRGMAGTSLSAQIHSVTDFPVGAGLASSAAAFASLATAVSESLDLPMDPKSLSLLARRGSGSAARSVFGGFSMWKRGDREDGSDSFAAPIASPEHWPEFRMIICLTSKAEKRVSSRVGMARTVETSPLYEGWLASVEGDLLAIREGIHRRDFGAVGEAAEHNCLKMHATMLAARPPILYWNAGTVAIMEAVRRWREEGLPCYFTIDAGPQVKILCLERATGEIVERLNRLRPEGETLLARPGEGASIIGEHLF